MTPPDVLENDPNADTSTSPDVPMFGVKIGPSEITIFLTILASLLTLIFHKDWGLSAHIQNIAAQALYVLPIALGAFRTLKHWIATHNNAKVAVAKAAGTTWTKLASVDATPVSTDPSPTPDDTSIPNDIPVAPAA